jgi:hypothetical protein
VKSFKIPDHVLLVFPPVAKPLEPPANVAMLVMLILSAKNRVSRVRVIFKYAD